MKKGKIFGKKQIALAAMVLALGGAVWLNMKYSAAGGFSVGDTSSTKYLGEATLVDGDVDTSSAVETAGDAEKKDEDYFTSTRDERNKKRRDAISELEDTVSSAKTKDSVKQAAVEKITELTDRIEKESSIEALLRAKGFNDVLAVIGDSDINIVIKLDKLTESQTVQIQDIATSQSGFMLDKVKIITVK